MKIGYHPFDITKNYFKLGKSWMCVGRWVKNSPKNWISDVGGPLALLIISSKLSHLWSPRLGKNYSDYQKTKLKFHLYRPIMWLCNNARKSLFLPSNPEKHPAGKGDYYHARIHLGDFPQVSQAQWSFQSWFMSVAVNSPKM